MIDPTFRPGLAEIASRYRGFIVDQWGVLHDGQKPYPGALDCLARLRESGARVVLLTNSGKREAENRARLLAMGFAAELFDAVVTSGEAAWRALFDRQDPFFADLGERCLLLVQAGDREVTRGLPLTLVHDAEDADFILLAGVDLGARPSDFEPMLRRALARDLPLVCANPDVVVVAPDGLHLAPGALARWYAEEGGRVAYLGKPHAPIYRLCLEALAPLRVEEILAVGDSIEHDVAGGNAMCLDTALIMGGIHAAAFDSAADFSTNRRPLDHLIHAHGARPRWVLPRFRWQAQ